MDFLNHKVTVKSFLGALAIVCTFIFSGTTLYWTTEMREAIEVERDKQERVEFDAMKVQLTRIETSLLAITTNVQTLQSFHASE